MIENEDSPDLTADEIKSVINVSSLDKLGLRLKSYFETHGNPEHTSHELRVHDNRHYWRVRMKYLNQEKTLLFSADWLDF